MDTQDFLSEKELEELRSGVMNHPALKLFADEKARQKIIFGDIERPTEFDKFIVQESDDTNVYVKSQLAYLARESAYIGRHLARLLEEKIDGEIAEWYKQAECPFTYRLVPIKALYKKVDDTLAEILPRRRKDFRASYRKMLAVAKQCNREQVKWFGALPVKPIAKFGLAAAEFYKTICTIHRGALIEMNKLTQPASGKEDLPNEKPAETMQNTDVEKKETQEGVLEPKPPEFLQKLLWIKIHGKKYWKLILLAILILFVWYLFTKIKISTLIKDISF